MLFDFFKKDNSDLEINGGALQILSRTINFGGPRYRFVFMSYNKLCRLFFNGLFQEFTNEADRYIRRVVKSWIVLKKNGKYLFVEKDRSIQLIDDMKYFIDSEWLNSRDAFEHLWQSEFNVNLNDYEIIEVRASQMLQILSKYGF